MREYLLATTPHDYRRCHQLLNDEKVFLTFPTVMAVEDGEVVGFLSTRPNKQMVLAGPLRLVEGPRRPFTALRLVEAYENVLRLSGVTTYFFQIENPELLPQIKRSGIFKDTGDSVFRRDLEDGQHA